MTELKISFVLPTKNEEKTITPLIHQLKELSEKNNWKSYYLVVDDSSDLTRKLAIAAGAEVIDGESIGLGYSMLKGLAKAKLKEPDYIVTLDTDGQVELNEIKKFIDVIKENKIDVLLSSRFLKNELIQYKYPKINYFGNRVLVFILRYCTHFPFTDSHGGIRVLNPKVVDNLKLIGLHTYVQETLISFCRSGYKVQELPSLWMERKHNHSRVLKSMSQYILRTLPGLLFLMNFHKIFIFISIVFLFINFFWTLNSNLLTTLSFILGVLFLFIINAANNSTHIKDFDR